MKPTPRFSFLAIMLLALTLSGCGAGGPPKDVLDESVAKNHANVTHYEITNQYTRRVNDETFYVYEFAVDWVWKWQGSPDSPKKSNDTIGFVKRGNSWYWRDWE